MAIENILEKAGEFVSDTYFHCACGAALLIDQLSKTTVEYSFRMWESYKINDYVKITRAVNDDVEGPFGVLGATAIFTGIATHFYVSWCRTKLDRVMLGIGYGAGMSNLIDAALHKKVMDFIDAGGYISNAADLMAFTAAAYLLTKAIPALLRPNTQKSINPQ